jgi:hypothetical protein
MNIAATRAFGVALVAGCVSTSGYVHVPEPIAGSDCPSLRDAAARPGELIVAHGFTPDPQFRVTGLVYVFDGQVLFNASGGDISNAFIVLRKGISGGSHSLQVIAHLEGLGDIAGYKFVVPASHSFQTDGVRAVCLDSHFGFKNDATASVPERPSIRFSEVPLAVSGGQ